MNLSRRSLLKASLGATQLALLAKLGLMPKVAHAAGSGGPTKLLTIYFPGGWMPIDLFCPLAAAEIGRLIPTKTTYQGDPVFFAPTDVTNLDGTGDTLATTGRQRLRVPKLWDATALSAGAKDPRGGGMTSPNGWSWVANRLWENTCVVHGVDMGTAGHVAGAISAMSGIAGNDFRSPSLHAHVANSLYGTYGDSRPLPCVQLWEAPSLNALNLRPESAPVSMYSTQLMGSTFDEGSSDAWAGFRGRTAQPAFDFDGNPLPNNLPVTATEAHLSARIKALKGANAGTDAMLKSLYENYQGISRLMAQDVVTKVQATSGVQYTSKPFWAPNSGGFFAVDVGGGAVMDDGSKYDRNFKSVLQLLKSDVTTSIGVVCEGLNQFNFDTHPANGHLPQFVHVRAAFEAVGRLLGEMKATPLAGGRTLLDDTLVILCSEFSRTWPNSNSCDHWQYTSVAFVGGGVQPNQMIGNYDTANAPANAIGYTGVACDVVEENGAQAKRPLRSADVIQTALRIMGIKDVRIPGGSGEIVGVKA